MATNRELASETASETASACESKKPVVQTRADLLEFLKSCQERPTLDVIEDLYTIMGDLGVIIRHEQLAPAPPSPAAGVRRAVPAAIEVAPDGTAMLSLSRIFESDDPSQPRPQRGTSVYRLLLSCGRGANAAQREFGGLVIDTRSWSVIAAPPAAPNRRPPVAAVDAALAAGHYDIFRVDDGTVATLYNWAHPQLGPTWALATSNGYDVLPLRWMGPLTFAEVFLDIVTRLYPDFVAATGARLRITGGTGASAVAGLDFDRLDPSHSFVIGFRHHDFHPLRTDAERMWLIQASPPGATLPGIPLQTPLAPAGLASASAAAPTVASLKSSCAGSREDAIALIAMSHAGATPPIGRGHAPALNYGYILRRKPGAPPMPDHAHVLVESPLLELVRRLAYERAPRAVRDGITADDRFAYNAMRAFLTLGDRELFVALFPEIAPQFAEYSKFINSVVSEAVHELRQRQRSPLARARPISVAGHIAAALIDHISSQIELSVPHRDAESIVRDQIAVPDYAFLFLRAIDQVRKAAMMRAPAASTK